MSKGSNRRPEDAEAFSDGYSKIFSNKLKRGSFVWDEELREMVPKSEYYENRSFAPMIIPDIQPYKSMATGEIVGGRSQHREHLKRNNLIEIGNETKYLQNQRKSENPNILKQRIADIVNCKLK